MKKRYHLKLDPKMIEGSRIALLPGDPGRVQTIANFLDNGRQLASYREWNSHLGELRGKKILVVSTGVGGPSTSICVDELAQLGVTAFIRIGTTGAIQPHIVPGDLIVTTASVRLDGAGRDYAPVEYPAVADFDITTALVQSARLWGVKHHVGITASTDTFYQGQERYDSYAGTVPRRLKGSMKEWQRLSVLNYEMESGTLLAMCAAMGLRAGCISGVLVNRCKEEEIDPSILESVESKTIGVAVKAAEIIASALP